MHRVSAISVLYRLFLKIWKNANMGRLNKFVNGCVQKCSCIVICYFVWEIFHIKRRSHSNIWKISHWNTMKTMPHYCWSIRGLIELDRWHKLQSLQTKEFLIEKIHCLVQQCHLQRLNHPLSNKSSYFQIAQYYIMPEYTFVPSFRTFSIFNFSPCQTYFR